MIWEPFVMALVLGLLVSAGLYFAYLWPSVEPLDDDDEEQPVETKPAEPAPAIVEKPSAEQPKAASEEAPSIPKEPEVIAGPPKEPEPPEPSKTASNDGKPTEDA